MANLDYSSFGFKEEKQPINYGKMGFSEETSAPKNAPIASQPMLDKSFLQSAGHALYNLPTNVLLGLVQAGEGLHNFWFPGYASHTDWQKELPGIFGIKNQDETDKIVQGGANLIGTEAANPFAAVARGAKLLPNMLSSAAHQGLTGAMLGAQSSPEDEAIGAGLGAGLGATGELGLAALKGGAKSIQSLYKPGKMIGQIRAQVSTDKLQALEDQASSMYKSVESKANKRYLYPDRPAPKLLLDARGEPISTPLYNPENNLKESSQYLKIANREKDLYFNRAIKYADQDFLSKPNFENSRVLDKRLGDEIRALKAKEIRMGRLNSKEDDQLGAFIDAQKALRQDQHALLNRIDKSGGLSKNLSKAHEFYSREVIPHQNVAAALEKKKWSDSNREIFNALDRASRVGTTSRTIGVPKNVEEQLPELNQQIKNQMSAIKSLKWIGGGLGVSDILYNLHNLIRQK